MNFSRFIALAAALALLAGELVLAACAVPLAPGYAVERELQEVRYVATPKPALAVHATYAVRNIGNRPLQFVEADVPPAATFGTRNLRVLVNGEERTPALRHEADWDLAQIPFAVPWSQKARLTLEISYELSAASAPSDSMEIGPTSFRASVGVWMPHLRAPRNFFAKPINRPKNNQLAIRVPQGWAAASNGQPVSSARQPEESGFGFHLGRSDLEPHLVGGKFRTLERLASGLRVNFWTSSPLDAAAGDAASRRIAVVVRNMERIFGRRARYDSPVWIVECTAEEVAGPASATPNPDAACASLPDVAFLPPSIFVPPVSPVILASKAQKELAKTWFLHLSRPAQDVPFVLANALAQYAQQAATETTDKAQSNDRIRTLLAEYDSQRAGRAEKRLAGISLTDPSWQVQIAREKAELFITALESRCGSGKFQQGLGHMVQALRGTTWQREDLRASLEAACGQNFARQLDEWLDQPGIPTEFRNRYLKDETQNSK